jgi:glutathione S-transferase
MAIVYHIPVCPFSQRLEILLELKGGRESVEFRSVDITKPRSPELLVLGGGSTALPILSLADGTVLRESLVILRYLDDLIPSPRVAQTDPFRHAVENLLISHEREFGEAGYRLLMNRDPARRESLRLKLLEQYALLNDLLNRYSKHNRNRNNADHISGPWLWDRFGLAEAVFTPLFMRFWCLGYYEDFALPDDARFARVQAWEAACLAHPAAQQVNREEVIKLYYDYAQGAGNGGLAPGRRLSSFALCPSWSERPWPPRDKYGPPASDHQLGLIRTIKVETKCLSSHPKPICVDMP